MSMLSLHPVFILCIIYGILVAKSLQNYALIIFPSLKNMKFVMN